jgi:hypothetical protein
MLVFAYIPGFSFPAAIHNNYLVRETPILHHSNLADC